MAEEEPVLQTAVVEVKYNNGVVYLDHCGALTLKLERELGDGFQATGLPTMTHGEFRNDIERIVVLFGSKQASVTQTWIPNPVRVEQLAPGVWHHVAEVLNVGSFVTRCGVRFIFLFKVKSNEEAEERVANCGLFGETDEWEQLFGEPTSRAWAATAALSGGGTVRAAINGMQTKIEGLIPRDLEKLIPPHAVALDLDYTYPGQGVFGLKRDKLKEFIRSSWQHATSAAKKTGEKLR